MVAPVARVPGRIGGTIARKTGKQTLERPSATLPGTAFKAKRIGSRDVTVRHAQSRADRRRAAPVARASEVERRVDEFYDFSRQKIDAAEARGAREAKQRGLDPDAGKAHVEQARTDAQHEMDAAFAREFGAHQRPSVGAAEKRATKVERRKTKQRKEEARARAQAAHVEVKEAVGAARSARGTGTSLRLTELEQARGLAQRTLASEQAGQHRVRLEQARAHGAARVSQARPKTTPRLQELHGRRRELERQAVTQDVKDARAQVSAADRRVAQLERTLQREQQTASRLEGVTEGRHAAGRMTRGAGKRAADQAERVGMLQEVLTEARRASATARDGLKATERDARTATRARVGEVKREIGAERRRVAGVAPREADRLLAAEQALTEAPARVRAARQQIGELDRAVAAERARMTGVPPAEAHRLTSALMSRDEARAASAARRAEHKTTKRRDIETKQQAAAATLTGGLERGRVFADEGDANKVAQRLNEAAHQIPEGGASPVRFPPAGPAGQTVMRSRKNVHVPLDFTVRKVGDDRFAVVPTVAAERLMKHQVVGTSKATGAKLLRTSRQMFTNAVLPLSPKWLFGQVAEPALRGAVARSGPLDYVRLNQTVKRMNKAEPGSGDDLLKRIAGGQFGKTGPAREFSDKLGTLGETFADTPLRTPARAASWVGRMPPARATKAVWGKYRTTVLGSINGLFEQTARKAMAGQAIRQGPLMQKRLNGLTNQAIDDAAKGLKGTDAQVQLAREVDRMYGQYQKFSPGKREAMAHFTPFAPWYFNALKFLGQVLPRDHPVLTSLMASASAATEDWRRENDLSLWDESTVPKHLMGGYPLFGGDKISRLGQYTPFGWSTDPVEGLGTMALPQALGPVLNTVGVDWTGKRLVDPKTGKPFSGGEKALRAAVSALEAQVPGVAQAGRISGLTKRYVDKKRPQDIPPLLERLKREAPLYPVGGAVETGGGESLAPGVVPVKVKPVKVKPVKVKPVTVKR